ncbi:hypothetical protein [Salirhabdus salicampi]|uniref:hypothetical protein n=1 Tax=Salirhabdus salicampi TaxID=476102 RepID=UPI0020C24408|nr:hypothetical protein [Salirhabdus salicampi]MCP8616429.1 hypothetical protein [Salirhabdus salicampi]
MSINWQQIHKKYTNSVLMVTETFVQKLDNVDRDSVLQCDEIIEYNIQPNFLNRTNEPINRYKILSRSIDLNNNVIVFVEKGHGDM